MVKKGNQDKDNFIESLAANNGKKTPPSKMQKFREHLDSSNGSKKSEEEFFESFAPPIKNKPLPPELKESLKTSKNKKKKPSKALKSKVPGKDTAPKMDKSQPATSKPGAVRSRQARTGQRKNSEPSKQNVQKRTVPKSTATQAQASGKPKMPPKDQSAKPSIKREVKPARKKSPRKQPLIQHAAFDQFYEDFTFAQNLNAQTILGLDIDTDKLRYVIVKKSGDMIKAKAWGSQLFPTEESDRFKALQIALENIKAKIYKPNMQIYASIFSPDMNIRQIIIPKVEKKQDLEKAIFFKNKSDMHNFDEKSSWNYKILNEFEEDEITKLRILCIVVPPGLVDRYLFLFKSLKMELKELVARPSAIHSAYKKMIRYPIRDMVIDISYDFTQICFMRMGKLEYVRNLGIGSRNLELSIHDEKSEKSDNDNIRISDTDATNKSEESNPQENIRNRLLSKIKDLKTKQNPVLHTFFSEILRSLAYLQKKGTHEFIERIFITGYGIKKESLLPYLRNRLNMPVLILSPKFRSGATATEFGDYYTAFGAMAQEDKSFSLLPTHYRTQFILSKLNLVLIASIILSLAGFTYFGFAKGKTIRSKQNLVTLYQKQYDAINPAERKYKNIFSQINVVQGEKLKLQKIVKTPPPLTELMRVFSNETPKEVRLQKLEFSSIKTLGDKPADQNQTATNLKYQAIIVGSIESNNLLADVILVNYINHLRDLGYFQNINLLHSGKDPASGRTEFQLELLY